MAWFYFLFYLETASSIPTSHLFTYAPALLASRQDFIVSPLAPGDHHRGTIVPEAHWVLHGKQ
jgi:hypothetical protein